MWYWITVNWIFQKYGKRTIGDIDMKIEKWLLGPVCGGKTRLKLREDTILENFPLYCPKCRQETLIRVQKMNMSVIKEPDAQTQSR